MPVNTGHAIGQYARFVLRPSESVLNELLTGTVNGGTAGTTVSTSGGLAYKPASSATTWALVETGLDPFVSGDLSFFWYGVLPGDTAQTLLDCSGTSYGWNVTVSSYSPGNVVIGLGAKWGGPNQRTYVLATDGTTPVSIGAVFINSTSTAKLYVNGSVVASGSFSKDPGAMGASQTFSMSGNATNPQKMVTTQAFAHALSDADMVTLGSDPFAIFTAAPISASVSATDNDDVLSASGTLVVVGPVVGTVAYTDDDDVLSSTGSLPISGQVNITDDDDTMVGGTYDPYVRLRGILASTPKETWVKVNLNSFLDVTIPTASQPPFPDSLGNSASVVYAWSGFAIDEFNGNIVMFGGGHANYYGNEVYIWNGQSGTWGLGSLPSKVDFTDTVSATIPSKDGPQSSHTYGNNVYLPNNKMFGTFGGAAAKSGGPMEELVTSSPHVTRRVGPWVFDISKADPNKVGGGNATGWDPAALGSGAWKLRVDMVDATDPAFLYDLSARSHVGSAAVVVDEAGVDVAYFTMDAGGSGFPYWCKYVFGDIRAGGRDTFSRIGSTVGGVTFDGFGVYDSKRGMMYRNSVRMSGNTSDILALRVKGATGITGTTPIQLKDINGVDFPLNDWNGTSYVRECPFGAVYDPVNDRLWLWRGKVDAPNKVYYIDLPAWSSGTGWASTTWTIKEISPAGVSPRGNHSANVLGKMRYVPALGAFIVMDSTTLARTDDPAVWLFKTSGASSAYGYVNVSGAYKSVNQTYVNVSGIWKTAVPLVNVGGTWKTLI